MNFFTLIIFAIALNIDAIAAGVTYGVRGIKIPLFSVLIISGMSSGAIILSMTAGHMAAALIPAGAAHRVGGAALLITGIWILFQALTKKHNKNTEDREENHLPRPLLQIQIKNPGLVIRILREPQRADLDRSGCISTGEAALLGTALALDALGAGFAVSMLGFAVGTTALVVGLGHIAMTYAGLFIGRKAGATGFCRHAATLPGCILIALGICKIY